MNHLRILVSRHSAFYSPLIGTIAGGFLRKEGLEATYGVLQPGQTSHAMISSGQADIIQSAVSSNWKPMERGVAGLPLHFAQINCRDGFFLVGRAGGFTWSVLLSGEVLADHALQPLAMLKYAARSNGVAWNDVRAADCGSPEEMGAAFRAGRGDYVHLQGPAAQQLEHDGVGKVLVSVGASMPAVAFSSLTASREFLETDVARAFVRAYTASRRWAREAPPADVAAAEAEFFPGVPPSALAATVERYQQLGCWEGGVEIQPELYEQSLNVFLDCGAISRRWAYEDVVVPPPV